MCDLIKVAGKYGLMVMRVAQIPSDGNVAGSEDALEALSTRLAAGNEAIEALRMLVVALESGHVNQEIMDQAKAVLAQASGGGV